MGAERTPAEVPLADTGLAAHILLTLTTAGKPTSLYQAAEMWERHRPDETRRDADRNLRRALTRLAEARVIVWHGSNRIGILSGVLLRLAAAHFDPGTGQVPR